MKQKKQSQPQNKLSTWLARRPMQFAVISFLLMAVITFTYSGIAWLITHQIPSRVTISTLTLASFTIGAWWLIRKLPNDKMDRPSFIALANAQIFILSIVFMIITIVMGLYGQTIMLKLMWTQATSPVAFYTTATITVLVALYLFGIMLSNAYAKFCRAREMGIPKWRIICSIPFGFSLMWIPGYLLPDQTPRTPAISIGKKWYTNFTDRVMTYPSATALMFVITTLVSAFFFGFNLIMLTLFWGLVFALWGRIRGIEKFRNDIRGKYSIFATIINIIAVCTLVTILALSWNKTSANITINITDTNPTIQQQ